MADTDDEAMDLCLHSMMGRAEREYLLPTFAKFGMTKHLAPNASVPESSITVEYLARHVWLDGSPDTVAARLREQYLQAGGFGTFLCLAWDYASNPNPWRRSMELKVSTADPMGMEGDL